MKLTSGVLIPWYNSKTRLKGLLNQVRGALVQYLLQMMRIDVNVWSNLLFTWSAGDRAKSPITQSVNGHRDKYHED